MRRIGLGIGGVACLRERGQRVGIAALLAQRLALQQRQRVALGGAAGAAQAALSSACVPMRPSRSSGQTIFSSSAAMTASMFTQYTVRDTPASYSDCTSAR